MDILFTIWSLVVFVSIVIGSLWLHFIGRSIQLGVSIVVAGSCAALFRIIVPQVVGSPRAHPGSLISRIATLESRVGEISGQLAALADAFALARERSRSRLIELTMSRLRRSHALLIRYRDRFDAQLVLLQFSLWMHATAAIVAEWERSDTRQLSVVYNRLIQRTDGCRITFEEVVKGKKSGGVYADAGASIRRGLARADSVADAMVARKAQLALAAVSPASLPLEPRHDSILEDFATQDLLRATEDLEREFDRIIAEHDLSEPDVAGGMP